MKFICFLVVFFTMLYILIAAHYINFDRETRGQNLAVAAKQIRDAQLSSSFTTRDYKDFVYAR